MVGKSQVKNEQDTRWSEGGSVLRKTKTLTKESQKPLKKKLTGPTLLSRWEKLGRGGTEDEVVKPLDGVQRVQVPPGQSEQAGR